LGILKGGEEQIMKPKRFATATCLIIIVFTLAFSWNASAEKNPWIAGIASLIIPGTGQMYCDKWLRGGVFLGAAIVTELKYEETRSVFWATLALGNRIASVIDASILAESVEVSFIRRDDGFQVAVAKRF
jgi:hypothetical protein